MSDGTKGKGSGPKPAAKGGSELKILVGAFFGIWILWNTTIVYPIKLLVVLLHELSHGIAAVVTGGSIVSIQISANQGGVCWTAGGSRFLTLSAGYLGSMAFGAAILLTAARTRHGDRALATGLGAVLLGVTLLYVRNTFGLVFGGLSGAALILVGTKLPNWVSDLCLKVIGMTSCLYAILDIKSDIIDRPGLRSDAAMLAERTHIPTVVWGLVWIALAVVVTAWTFRKAARLAGGSAAQTPGAR